MAHDWLVGRDRRDEATERIYAAAADLISRNGFDTFTIEALAKKAHCSPATIYRHVGGKTAIRDAVTVRLSARIVAAVRRTIKDLRGPDRVVTAVVVALRSEPLGHLMMGSARHSHDTEWVAASPVVSALAEEMIGGHDPDPAAAQWLPRRAGRIGTGVGHRPSLQPAAGPAGQADPRVTPDPPKVTY
jgi:AcrR family transcriptional regulator